MKATGFGHILREHERELHVTWQRLGFLFDSLQRTLDDPAASSGEKAVALEGLSVLLRGASERLAVSARAYELFSELEQHEVPDAPKAASVSTGGRARGR